MAATSTVLCIHRDPQKLTLLREKGYGLVTATNGREGLRLLMSRPVDAVVLEYHLGLLDGVMVANEIRRARPEVPIIMVADPVELPHEALTSVDTLSGQICRTALSLGCCPFPFDEQSRHRVLWMSDSPNVLRG